jgi:outer membrane protein assembly factor BamB
MTDSGVFHGYSGIPGIAKYSLDGDFLWEQTLNGTGVVYIYEIDGQVQVLTIPEKLSIFDTNTGELINKVKGEKIFITTPTEQFINLFGLTLLSPTTGKTIWETDLDGYFELAPIFSKNLIFVRTGQVIGSVYAIDRVSGKILWKTDDNIISNIAYTPSHEVVYVLSDKGDLIRIDSAGTTTTLLRFSKTPFFLNGDAQIGGYEVAYDEKTNSLFIALGDSRQLFAFHVQ